MHSEKLRAEAIALLDSGMGRRQVCDLLGIGYVTTYRWRPSQAPPNSVRCFRCLEAEAPGAYTYLLGQYLGDGCLSRLPRTISLRVTCCDAYPAIMAEVEQAMRDVAGVSVFRTTVPDGGCTQVGSATKHWLCMLPHHGPGMKHTRKIELEGWQREAVASDPKGLVRGLIHSDGCRCTNTIIRTLPSGRRRYAYPRYFFINESADIREIYTDALDLLGIAWRQNRHNSISVARREAVAALDQFVGPKS